MGTKRTSGPREKKNGRRKRTAVQSTAVGGGGIPSRLNCFRKFLVRYEKKARNYLALVELVYAVIIWRNPISIYPGFISG
jgi:hypothetical protein